MAGTDDERRQRERETILLLFLLLLGDTDHTLTADVTRFLSGTSGIAEVTEGLTTTLTNAHGHAAYLGRRAAGHRQPMNAADRSFGGTVMVEQATFLQGLLHDLESGRYALTDGKLPGDLAQRLLLYARGIRATAQEAWCLALPAGTRIHWRLGSEPEHHCTVCPEIAAAGPYDAHDMPTFPGAGDTPCLANCFCFLETDDGLRGFVLE